MIRVHKVITQTARSVLLVRFFVAILVAAFAILFVPFSYENELVWFLGLVFLSYVLVSYTMGFRSWVTTDDTGKYTLCIRDNNARSNAYVPFEYITHFEQCEYSIFKNSVNPTYKNREYHRHFKYFGYQGPGLLICYQLPKQIIGDSETRSWQLPAPKAAQFIQLLDLG